MGNDKNIEEIIERINFLYKKSQENGLTAEEKEEQSRLRRIYIDRFKSNLKAQLDTIQRKPSGYRQ